MSNSITLQKLAELVGGTLSSGSPESIISGLNSILEANPGEVTFLGNARYLPGLKTTRASAALVPEDLDAEDAREGLALIRLKNPTFAFSHVIRFFGPPAIEFVPGVHPSATVASGVVYDPQKVSIGPNAVIEAGVHLGDGCTIHAGVYLGRGVKLGAGCVIHANAVIKEYCILGQRVILHSGSVIGSDGFGYEQVQGRHQKIDQVGIVQIDDDVEIGSCTTIDRARFGRTWIGEGTKIDNLVQIGHNVVIGKHCIVVACTAIAGSAVIGDYVVIAAQVGIAGHVHVGSQSTLAARCGVTRDLPGGQTYLGFPAIPVGEEKRRLAGINRLPQLVARVKELAAQIAGTKST